MATHAIIGTGSAPSKVILDGLKEAIEDGDSLVVPWYGNPADGSGHEAVYTFIKDSEVETAVLYTDEDKIPAALRDWDNVTAVKTRNPIHKALDEVGTDGAVLFLWDDDNPDQIEEVFQFSESLTVLELSNGLAPIVLGDDEPAPPAPVAEEDDEEEEEEDPPLLLTRDEVEIMTAAAVKEYGQRRGCTAKTKAGIIEELFGEEQWKKYAEEEEPAAEERTSAPSFDVELVDLIKRYFSEAPTGFESDMAALSLGQARLWMQKSLGE